MSTPPKKKITKTISNEKNLLVNFENIVMILIKHFQINHISTLVNPYGVDISLSTPNTTKPVGKWFL